MALTCFTLMKEINDYLIIREYYNFNYKNFQCNLECLIMIKSTSLTKLNNNNIIDDSSYESEINKNSFCYYLAEAVKEVFFSELDIPVTLQGIKNFIESLWLEDQEETRIKFIQTLCQMYQADEKKPKQNSNDNTDRLFLESVACKNFTIFLNGYLPLSKDDNIQSPIYTRIGHVDYPFNLDIEKREFPVVKVTKTTKPTVVRKELQEEKTSFYQLLLKLTQEICQNEIGSMVQLINIIKNFSQENSAKFLKELLFAWRKKSEREAARYNQSEDADFLRAAGHNNYTLFLRECFSTANDLQKYLFGAIGAATISVDLHEQHGKPGKINIVNINNASDSNLVTSNSKIAHLSQIENNNVLNRFANSFMKRLKNAKIYGFFANRNLSPEEKYERFEVDEKAIRVGVKKYIFARYICNSPKENVPLTSIGESILIEGGKKALGLICTPIKAALYVQKIINKVFDKFEQMAFEKQYVDFFEDVGDLACNLAIEHTLKRVRIIMKEQFKQLDNYDYKVVVRYLSNKMAQGFDSINYSLIDSNNQEYKTMWMSYSLDEKLIEMERMLFLCIFEPVKGQYLDENISILGVSYQVERFMARAPLKFANDEKLYPRERDGKYKEATNKYTYKGPAFNGDVYLAAKEGRDLAQDDIMQNNNRLIN